MDALLFENTALIDASTLKAAGINILIAEALIPIFFSFSIVYDIVQRTLGTIDGERPSYFSKKELVRLMSIMLMAGPLYIAIFWPISTAVNKIAKVTEPTYSQVVSSKEEILEQFNPTPGGTPDNAPKAWWDVLLDEAKKGVSIGINAIVLANTAPIVAIILAVISTVIKLFATVLSKMFFIIGPLAIAFSMIPAFKDKLSAWFGVYLNCLFVPITINGMDYLYYSNIAEGLRGTEIINPMINTAFNIVIVICYCLAFWMTSFYVGSSGAGKVLSTAASAATTVAGMAIGKLGGGGAAAMSDSRGGNIVEDGLSMMKK